MQSISDRPLSQATSSCNQSRCGYGFTTVPAVPAGIGSGSSIIERRRTRSPALKLLVISAFLVASVVGFVHQGGDFGKLGVDQVQRSDMRPTQGLVVRLQHSV